MKRQFNEYQKEVNIPGKVNPLVSVSEKVIRCPNCSVRGLRYPFSNYY